MSKQTQQLLNEADIGSGEKSVGQKETEQQIAQIPVQNAQQESKRGKSPGKQKSRTPNQPAGNRESPEQLSHSLVDMSNTFPPKGN